MEACVDDMVIKSMDKEDILADIRETFERLRRINMKLNPKKCSFGMEDGEFIEHIVSKQGIKANPTKKDFMWTREVDKAFEDMKRYIENLSTLMAPKAGESMIVYLAASRECGAELNYPIMEKLVLALIHAAKRLKRDFKAHKVIVLTNKPITLLLLKPENRGRVARWAIELEEHEIEYKPKNAIKVIVLADFMTETQEEDEETDFQDQEDQKTNIGWKLYTDGASSNDGSGDGLMIVSSEGMEFTYALKFKFTATNNEVGYKSVIAGLRIAKEMKIEEIVVYLDSQLVAN
ncbi:reverse transcriptase domain-containing protein [Tanacetum coccineum]